MAWEAWVKAQVTVAPDAVLAENEGARGRFKVWKFTSLLLTRGLLEQTPVP